MLTVTFVQSAYIFNERNQSVYIEAKISNSIARTFTVSTTSSKSFIPICTSRTQLIHYLFDALLFLQLDQTNHLFISLVQALMTH